jgi:ParB-like chromosome segregation protein Spo0J
MKRPKLHNNPLSWVETKQVEIKGVRLSDVQYVSPKKLTPNTLNSFFFKEESSEYFSNLREDIRERGIIVPLIAKKDDTLLAGHNRLRLARELGLENVPVQYVLDGLNDNAEKEFIIKDNLYRRQFSAAEWIELYKKLYPEFDEQIQQETRGGGRKWNKTEDSVLLPPERQSRLTAEKIASDTGQKISAVQKQLTKYRREIRPTQEPSKKAAQGEPSVLVQEIFATLDGLERKLRNADEKTVRQVVKKLEACKTRLERLLNP